MDTNKIETAKPKGADPLVNDLNDLQLMGSLYYLSTLLMEAATIRQNTLMTNTKLVNSDVEAQKTLQQQLIQVRDVSLDGLKTTEYKTYEVEYQYKDYFEGVYIKTVVEKKEMIKKATDPAPIPSEVADRYAKGLRGFHLNSVTCTGSYLTYDDPAQLNDLVHQGQVLQEQRDGIQSHYGLASKSAETNSADNLSLVQIISQLQTCCGAILDLTTKMTNTLVIPV